MDSGCVQHFRQLGRCTTTYGKLPSDVVSHLYFGLRNNKALTIGCFVLGILAGPQ